MKTFENGDLVKLSLHGKFLTRQTLNLADKIGIVLCNNVYYGNLVLVKWFSTGGTSETHVDFIEKVEKKT